MNYLLQNNYVSYWNTSLTQIQEEELQDEVIIVNNNNSALSNELYGLSNYVYHDLTPYTVSLSNNFAGLSNDFVGLSNYTYGTLSNVAFTNQSNVNVLYELYNTQLTSNYWKKTQSTTTFPTTYQMDYYYLDSAKQGRRPSVFITDYDYNYNLYGNSYKLFVESIPNAGVKAFFKNMDLEVNRGAIVITDENYYPVTRLFSQGGIELVNGNIKLYSGSLQFEANYSIYFNAGTYHQLWWRIVDVSGTGKSYLMLQFKRLSNNDVGFIVRFYGGVGTTTGTLPIAEYGAHVDPVVSNTYELGDSDSRWKNIFLNNNPNVSSDRRLKTNIEDSDIGLQFINDLKPKRYKMIQGSKRLVGSNIEKDEYYYEDVAGVRNHYGFIAQEVKEALDKNNVIDFSGWCLEKKEDPDSLQALQYESFIAPMCKAIQELSSQVQMLKLEIQTLKGN